MRTRIHSGLKPSNWCHHVVRRNNCVPSKSLPPLCQFSHRGGGDGRLEPRGEHTESATVRGQAHVSPCQEKPSGSVSPKSNSSLRTTHQPREKWTIVLLCLLGNCVASNQIKGEEDKNSVWIKCIIVIAFRQLWLFYIMCNIGVLLLQICRDYFLMYSTLCWLVIKVKDSYVHNT